MQNLCKILCLTDIAMTSSTPEKGLKNLNIKIQTTHLQKNIFEYSILSNMDHIFKNCRLSLKYYQKHELKSIGMIPPIPPKYKANLNLKGK